MMIFNEADRASPPPFDENKAWYEPRQACAIRANHAPRAAARAQQGGVCCTHGFPVPAFLVEVAVDATTCCVCFATRPQTSETYGEAGAEATQAG